MRKQFRRLWPLLLIVAMVGAVYGLGLHEYLTLDALREHRETLQSFVREHALLAILAYIATYVAVVALSCPGATAMSVASGFLFGLALGGTLAVVAATIGATLLFLAARTAIGDLLRRRAGPYLHRLEKGFHENALNYLLFLRIVPLFPFWAVNLAMAVLGMKVGTFVLGTFVGIIPGTFVFAAIGSGLGDVFDAGKGASMAELLSPTLLLAFGGLGALALVPILYRKWQAGLKLRRGLDNSYS